MSDNGTIIESVTPDRAWAIDMTQKEFDFEYEVRHPNADVIPDVKTYLYPPVQEDRSITPMNPEEYEEDGPAGHIPEVKEDPIDVLTCPGCGYVAKKSFTKKGKLRTIGIMAHMRKCKEVIKNG